MTSKTSKLSEKVSTILSEVLSSTLNKKDADKVLTAWNSRHSDVDKLSRASRGSKAEKDPNAPRKRRSAYIFYCSANREEVKRENPDLPATEITTKLAEMWNTLPDDQKVPFVKMSEQDKERYETERSSYVPSEPSESSKDTKKRGKKERKEGPKKALAAYMFFCQHARPTVKEECPELKGKDITVELGRRWNELTDEQKAPFVAKHEADKARYEREKASGVTSAPAQPAPAASKAPAKASAKASAKVATAPATAPAKAQPAGKAPAKAAAAPAKAPAKAPAGKASAKASTKVPANTTPITATSAPAAPASKKGKNDVKQTPGYLVFLDENRDELESDHPDWNETKVLTEVNKRWKELSASDREAYELEGAQQSDSESGVELEDD